MSVTQEKEQQFAQAADIIARVKDEIQSFIVGQEEVVEHVLWSIFSGGHVLLEGLPGLGKTMLIKTIAEVLDLKFSRIQFTPDIMPSDITGTMLLQPDEAGRQTFSFHKGPIFANIILADEINRATPKTQSALLEAMGEKTVTIMGETKKMEKPFFVLATQNPIDMEGTYPLPEAQTDRFLCKVNVVYPTKEELKEIARRTTGSQKIHLNKAAGLKDVIALQELSREILLSDEILDYAVWMVTATHPDSEGAPETVKKHVQYGSGPRGLQSLISMAKARAMCSGRFHVSIGDIKNVAYPVLRHRLILNFEGEAAGISADSIIEVLLKETSWGAKS
ncbi:MULTISPECIES: MoxR family ATPase [Cytobacillus]|uniref:AAA family ATPase n=2 Tax=Cytobacillus TaxID=2675230 RepID=A0ABX3CWS2_9BACI|nr:MULTISPECIES: AAA family ATPase [Cytobacillus]MCS0822897.1 AAA family ATPase [Cytobacillus firmus]MCM3242876.1 AAA family ATPase [Cytobacillus oceanisediminis]MCM3400756.1 AAA family ATPase [Cytobacillus oceanisediminis]MDK7665023.1 AAA family ATPase [Cytobacillus oceanisediminis]OHX49568.1 AAA family ATPase [Cytobacillus oceanisediminis]